MCGASGRAQEINRFMSEPGNGQFTGDMNDNSMMLTNLAGGRSALTADNQAKYDKMPWAPKQSPSLGSGSGGGGAASARSQPAATVVSSTVLGGTA